MQLDKTRTNSEYDCYFDVPLFLGGKSGGVSISVGVGAAAVGSLGLLPLAGGTGGASSDPDAGVLGVGKPGLLEVP